MKNVDESRNKRTIQKSRSIELFDSLQLKQEVRRARSLRCTGHIQRRKDEDVRGYVFDYITSTKSNEGRRPTGRTWKD